MVQQSSIIFQPKLQLTQGHSSSASSSENNSPGKQEEMVFEEDVASSQHRETAIQTQARHVYNTRGRVPRPTSFGRSQLTRSEAHYNCIVKLPRWLAPTIWEFHARRSISGWTFHLRSYAFRKWDSPVFDATRRRNIEELQHMFQSGEASPFDRVSDTGETLLHVSSIPMSESSLINLY
jgi:hypothetical protein